MTTITTKLVKDGNSKAVRLNSTVLAMSGLSDEVILEVDKGLVTIRPFDSKPRANWSVEIAKEIALNPLARKSDPELEDWENTVNDEIN